MPESPTSPTTDRVLGGRYRLVRPLARGGMAEVYEGHDDVLGRPVAVKVLHPHLAKAEGFTERFRREAVAAARLGHSPALVTGVGDDPFGRFVRRSLRDLGVDDRLGSSDRPVTVAQNSSAARTASRSTSPGRICRSGAVGRR